MFILHASLRDTDTQFLDRGVQSSVNHRGTRPAHSHLIHDVLWNRFLAQSPTGFFSFCLPIPLTWLGEPEAMERSLAQGEPPRQGIEPRPPAPSARELTIIPRRHNLKLAIYLRACF